MKKRGILTGILFFWAVTVILNGCREFETNPLPRDVSVTLETPLKTEKGYVNSTYALRYTVDPKFRIAPFTVTGRYSIDREATLSYGNKKYSPDDTVCFGMGRARELLFTPAEAGTYRLTMTFTDPEGLQVGTQELNFTVESPNLTVQLVRNGQVVGKMSDYRHFLEADDRFTIRVTSEKEVLNAGKLTVKMNIKGTSAVFDGWADGLAKISQETDDPHRVDFEAPYRNAAKGITSFTVTARTANATVVYSDSIEVVETIPGSLSLNTAYNEKKNFYSREQLWVGQDDSVEYVIQPDPNSTGNNFKLMLEMKDPTKISFFNTGNPDEWFTNRLYKANTWYDFNELTGKLYYTFRSSTTYSDTVFISMKNGEMGKVTKYKLFVSAKQSDDFDFNVTFKPELTEGYDVIKFSELERQSITDLIVLAVNDNNPYSEFDYRLSWQNMNYKQLTIKQAFQKEGYPSPITDVYGDWLAAGESNFGVLKNTKEFFIIVSEAPTNETASAFIGEFNWVYTIKRLSDSMEMSVTRQIKIIDDQINFDISSLVTQQQTYQNELKTMFRLIYDSPRADSKDYELTVTSTNENAADVYLTDPSGEFTQAPFRTAVSPPASHNTNGSVFDGSGLIQIKGKQAGTAILSFTLKNKASGAEKTIEKTVSTLPDEVRWEMAPAAVKDLTNVERNTVANGTEFHQYQNPRIRVRVKGESNYAGNHNGKAVIRISGDEYTAVRVDNAPKEYDTDIEVNYDQDYYITIHPTGMKLNSDGGWNTSSGTQTISVTAQKGNEQDVPIISIAKSYSASVREYRKSNLTWTHASLSTPYMTMGDWHIAFCSSRMPVGPYFVIMNNFGGCVTVRGATTASTTANVTLNKAVVSGGDAVDIRENTAGSFAAQYGVNEYRGDRLETSSGQAVAGNTLGERSYRYERNCTDVWGRPYTLSFNYYDYY